MPNPRQCATWLLEDTSVTVDGAVISYAVRRPSDPDRSSDVGIVLIHGHGGHRLWFHKLVPLLPDCPILAMDLSGHGRSAHRGAYSPTQLAHDVSGVIRHAGFGAALIAGHSMGGRIAALAASRMPEVARAVICMDTVFSRPEERNGITPAWSVRDYGSRDEILERFRLIPDQPSLPSATTDPLASYGVVEVNGRWRWRFDAHWPTFDDALINEALSSLECPVTVAYGGQSALPTAASAHLVRHLRPGSTVLEVPAGHHHLPLDSPVACAEVIEAALLDCHEERRA